MGDAFATALSDYDTSRRVDVLIDQFLPDQALVGKRALDVGCGPGLAVAGRVIIMIRVAAPRVLGDQAFQRKCLGRMSDIGRSGRTVVFVSHDTEFVTELAPTKVLLMPDGDVDYFSDDWLELVSLA